MADDGGSGYGHVEKPINQYDPPPQLMIGSCSNEQEVQRTLILDVLGNNSRRMSQSRGSKARVLIEEYDTQTGIRLRECPHEVIMMHLV